MWLPHTPSWSSDMILLHYSPCTHTNTGWVNPNLKRSPSIKVNLLDLFLTLFASDGSSGSTPSAKYRWYGVIHVPVLPTAQTSIASLVLIGCALTLGALKVSWVRDRWPIAMRSLDLHTWSTWLSVTNARGTFKVGMAKRGGPCGPSRRPLVKNARRADLFYLLTRISPRPARASSGAGRAGPLTRKKKKWMKVLLRWHPMLLKWKNVNNVYV